jgi:hypothetical protein
VTPADGGSACPAQVALEQTGEVPASTRVTFVPSGVART